MKVLFVDSVERAVSPQKPIRFCQIQLGISYLSASLTRRGHTTALLVLSSERSELGVVQAAVGRHAPDVVAFTCVSTQYPFIERAARAVRQVLPEGYLVIGGPHASLRPQEPAGSVFDAVCVGEGDEALCEVVGQLASGRRPRGVANMWLRQPDGSIQRNPPRPFLQELDSLPHPDRDMWLPWVQRDPFDVPSVLLGRGCPHSCTYCSNHALRRLASGPYVRHRSPASIVDEIEEVRRRFVIGDPCVYLETETIGIDKQWTLELCEALRRYNATLEDPLKFFCNFRISRRSVDKEIFEALAAAGFGRLNIGLESGSERVRRDVLKRDYSNADFRRAMQLARECGLEVNLFNMIGIPGETVADHMETVRLNREARPSYSYTSIFFPYPGTELYSVCDERGLLRGGLDPRMERVRPSLDLPEFPRRQVQRAYDLFEWRIRRGHWPLHVRLRRLLRGLIYRSPGADSVFRRLLPLWGRVSAALGIDRSYGDSRPTCRPPRPPV
jgi:anaerobic magnesium-protoporphyrin IX monomethyl ester cyclase